MRLVRIAAVWVLGVLLCGLYSGNAAARTTETLQMAAQPLSGGAGTAVTVAGRGATPYAAIEIGGGYRQYPEGCAAGIKGGQGNIQIFARTQADGAGNFAVEFRVLPGSADDSYAYFSALYSDSARDRSANLCFDIAGHVRTFPETGKTVRGSFLTYWDEHGGLTLNGYPISEAFTETLENGKAYTVQYFERTRLEFHDDLSVEPQILLGAFGRRIHPADPAVAAVPGATYFAQTGHNVTRRAFADYWNANGGVAQFGYPIGEEFDEALPGPNDTMQTYRVQYFERARFEYHPESADPYTVQLGQFGRAVCGEHCR